MRFAWTKRGIEDLTWHTLGGVSVSDIAARLGCEMQTARKMQIELELTPKRSWKRWTKTELRELRALYPMTEASVLAKQFRATVFQVYGQAFRMKIEKDPSFIAELARKHVSPGFRSTQFKPGTIPPNKGLRRPGFAPGRMASTQFRKGERSGFAGRNWKPVGSILANPEGYLRVKIRERVNGLPKGWDKEIWPLLHHRIWEQHRGTIPPGHKVIFKDGDRSKCEIENLELLSDAELMLRNTIHRYPEELRNTIMLLGATKRRLREYAEKHDDGSAEPSL